MPPAWAAVLPGWTRAATDAVTAAVQTTSGDRAIAPADPFRALRLVGPETVKVVILGQDPYPTAGHADGLAFSAGCGRPRSLARVFDVLATDRPGFAPPTEWRLDRWARQGALLLNPTLSVEIGKAGSHLGCGWQPLTSQIVRWLCERRDPPVFLLWGSKAQAFFADAAGDAVSGVRVLSTRHPSYDFRRAFMGEGSHFLATSELIDWWALESDSPPVL